MNILIKSGIILAIYGFGWTLDSARADDFKIIKGRVIAAQLNEPAEDILVSECLAKIRSDGGFQGINYADLSRNGGFPQGHHLESLLVLAKAYKLESSSYYQNEALKNLISKSLTFWVDHDFIGDNWHDNEVNTPADLTKLLLLMGNEFDPNLVARMRPIVERANINAWGARASGDRIVICEIYAKSRLFFNDRAEFESILKVIEGEMKFSTGSPGLQHDNSFHHRADRVNNTVSYGYGKYANAYAEWAYYVAGTEYQFSEEKINQLADYYLDGIYKHLVYGVYTDVSVKNRSVSRKLEAVFEPKGTNTLQRMLQVTDYRKSEFANILRLREGTGGIKPSFCTFFWQSEHFVFQRPNFYTTVRMHSTRNQNMEQPYNGDGIFTHHRGDGVNCVQRRGDEYFDTWPVCDWQKIPGTTVLQKPNMPPRKTIQKKGLTDFVGAVTDGLTGAATFDFRSPHDPVSAKKSWFFFDDAYVCLGAAIQSVDPAWPVVTTLNQTSMKSDVWINQHGKTHQLDEGNHALKQVTWVLQDRVGYLFPTPTDVHLSNEVKEGRWSDITLQKGASKEIVRKKMFSLWINHGVQPQTESYQYIVIPDVSKEELAARSQQQHHQIKVLSNTDAIQGVFHQKSGISQWVFYQAGEAEVIDGMKVQLDRPGMIMLQTQGDRILKLTVSDPSRKEKQVQVAVSGTYAVKRSGFTATSDASQQQTSFTVELPQGVFAGKSVTLDL